MAAGPGRHRGGVDAGRGPAGRGRRVRRRPGPGGGLPRGQRAPARPRAAFHRRVQRDRKLAAAPAPAGHRGRSRRGGHHRLAELAAHRRVQRAAGPPRPAGRRAARRHQAGHPGRWRRDQGRELPRRRGRIRHPGHAVLVGDDRRSSGVRLGRTGRAEHQLPAGPRRGAPAQTGVRDRPHRRPGPAGAAGRGLRRGRGAAAGVRRPGGGPGRHAGPAVDPARLLRAVPARRSRPPDRPRRRHDQLGRTGQPVPA